MRHSRGIIKGLYLGVKEQAQHTACRRANSMFGGPSLTGALDCGQPIAGQPFLLGQQTQISYTVRKRDKLLDHIF